eukprot:COSAG06_NODE_1138_length_10565_cov_16.902446_5_plen_189_part_00
MPVAESAIARESAGRDRVIPPRAITRGVVDHASVIAPAAATAARAVTTTAETIAATTAATGGAVAAGGTVAAAAARAGTIGLDALAAPHLASTSGVIRGRGRGHQERRAEGRTGGRGADAAAAVGAAAVAVAAARAGAGAGAKVLNVAREHKRLPVVLIPLLEMPRRPQTSRRRRSRASLVCLLLRQA